MIIAVAKETAAGERRVALTPAAAATLMKDGHELRIERGAGDASGFPDSLYTEKGAKVFDDRAALLDGAQIIVQVRTGDLSSLGSGQVVVGFADPFSSGDSVKKMAEKGAILLALELLPRITRAQSMDALSSQSNLAGYRAVISAANALGQAFPMMITAAGTIKPAKVFIVGAGVAGLQAIATSKRLGALVSAIDVRPEVREQVESLGARFISPPVEASGEGGYAKELTDAQKAQQQQMMADTVADSEVVITTALIPGRPAPKLVSAAMVDRMRPGSVIVDMAGERGGNCELSQPGESIVHNGVTILAPLDLNSQVAHDSSTMYAGNIVKLLQHLLGKTKQFEWKMDDPITAGVVVCKDGQMIHPQVRKALGLA